MPARLDRYTIRARLQPALLVAVPLALAVLAAAPGSLVGWGALWSVGIAAGGTALIAQLGRDQGRKKEQRLFESWGGAPTTRRLRHRHAPNKVTLARQHERLSEIVAGATLPTDEEEKADPDSADEVYEACVAVLRNKTRDSKRFPLIFEENCNYGFRRNLWGLKPVGIATSAIGVAAVVALVVLGLSAGLAPTPLIAACGITNLLLFLGWLVVFTPGWVRTTAEACADRLLEAVDDL